MKTCSKCKLEKDESEFYVRKDGLKPDCKTCYNLSTARYRATQKGKEAAKRADRRYRKTEKSSLTDKLYRKSYYGGSKVRQIEKRYRQSSKGHLVGLQKARRRRERKYNLDLSFSKENSEMIYDSFNHKCFNCGAAKSLGIDHHYPLSRGYGLKPENAVLLCRACNASKGNKMPEDFYSKKQLLDLAQILSLTIASR